MNNRELETVAFYREYMLRSLRIGDLPTLEDADEYKLPAVDKLLRKMREFHSELNSVGLSLKTDKSDQYPYENLYELMDTEYAGFPEFKIKVKSRWLNPKWRTAIHGGFEFHLHVVQDGYEGRYEIADWITIRICHLETTPISFTSMREHVKTLGFFYRDPACSYFHDLPMNFVTRVNFERIKDGLTFKTDAFNEAVGDACKVLQKIISRKQYLRVFGDKP